MKLNSGDSVIVYILRKDGALEELFTNLPQAEEYIKARRQNGEFWCIQEKRTVPHESKL